MKKTLLMILNEGAKDERPLAGFFAQADFRLVKFQNLAAALDYLAGAEEAPHAILLHGSLPLSAQTLFLSEMGRRVPDLYGSVPILLLNEPGEPQALKAPGLEPLSYGFIH